jgi:hypothetical protein
VLGTSARRVVYPDRNFRGVINSLYANDWILLLLLFTAIGFSPGGSIPYTSIHNTNGHINIHKNNNTKKTIHNYKTKYIQQIQVHKLEHRTHITKHPHLTKASTPYKNVHTLQIHQHLKKHPYTYKTKYIQ